MSLRGSRGYTLIEAMVVVAIMALMTVIAVPWFVKITQRNALKSAAREIQITLTAARMTAVKRNAPVSVVITSLTPPIAFQVVEPPPPNPTPTLPPKYVVLSANAIGFQTTPSSVTSLAFGADGRPITTPVMQTTPWASIFVEGPPNANASVRNKIEIRAHRGGAVEVITPVDWR